MDPSSSSPSWAGRRRAGDCTPRCVRPRKSDHSRSPRQHGQAQAAAAPVTEARRQEGDGLRARDAARDQAQAGPAAADVRAWWSVLRGAAGPHDHQPAPRRGRQRVDNVTREERKLLDLALQRANSDPRLAQQQKLLNEALTAQRMQGEINKITEKIGAGTARQKAMADQTITRRGPRGEVVRRRGFDPERDVRIPIEERALGEERINPLAQTAGDSQGRRDRPGWRRSATSCARWTRTPASCRTTWNRI